MNKNLFDFGEEKFLEKLPTVINGVKKVLDETRIETYQNESFGENKTMQNSIGAKQLVRVREINGPGSAIKEVKETQKVDNYPIHSPYQMPYENTTYTNQKGLSTVLTFMLVILLIALVFAVSTFIFKIV